MSMIGKTLLKGHALWREGRACTPNGFDLVDGSLPGYAFCECDARSVELPTTAARKRWHKQHKEEILAKEGKQP